MDSPEGPNERFKAIHAYYEERCDQRMQDYKQASSGSPDYGCP